MLGLSKYNLESVQHSPLRAAVQDIVLIPNILDRLVSLAKDLDEKGARIEARNLMMASAFILSAPGWQKGPCDG